MTTERARAVSTLLVIVIVVLLGQIVWEESRVQGFKSQLARSQRQFNDEVGKVATERLRGHRADTVRAVKWLHEFYMSPDGLQRPRGLWREDRNEPDFEAIGTWVFDVYLNARLNGASDETARQSIAQTIRESDEWRRLHAAK